MINDQLFIKSGFCNIDLVDARECPIVAQMIYQNYLVSRESPRTKDNSRMKIQTKAKRGQFRMSESAKSQMETAIRAHFNSEKTLLNDNGPETFSNNNMDAQSIVSNPLDYSINELWEKSRPSAIHSQDKLTQQRYNPTQVKSNANPRTEPSSAILRNEFKSNFSSDYIEAASEEQPVFIDHENNRFQPNTTISTTKNSPPRDRETQDRYVPISGADFPSFMKKQESEFKPTSNFLNTNNSLKTNGASRPTIDQDPFIKRMNELRGVYDEMKRNIGPSSDPSNNYFVNIQKKERAETLQDLAYQPNLPQKIHTVTPTHQLNPEPSQVSLVTNSNQGTKRESRPTQSKIPALPPLKDKIKMIANGASSGKSSAKPTVTKKLSKSVLEDKKSTDRISSHEGSHTLLNIKPQRQTFGKDGLPPTERKPSMKRPDPREVKEKYTVKLASVPSHSRKTSKVGDIIMLNDMSMSHHERDLSYDGALSKDSLLNQDSFMLKDPTLAEQRSKRPLMPIKVRSKSALKVLKEVSPDEKYDYDEKYIKMCENLAKMITNFNSLRTSNDIEIGINNLVNEFRKQNAFFVKLSQYTGTEILKNCNIIVMKNQNIYSEHEYNPNSYIILYGAVYLKNKALGLFKQCLLGESIAEESVLERNYNKQETAKVVDETAVLELTSLFMEKLKITLKASYPSDYMILTGGLKKNLLQKKSLRALGTLKI